MTDLAPLTALGDAAPRRATFGALTLTEENAIALASLALRRGVQAPQPRGLQLPDVGVWVAGDGIAAFWAAPGQWMIEGPHRAESDFARDVAAAAPGCCVTEQTDGWVCLEMSAPPDDLRRLLEKLVNHDPTRLTPGHAIRCGLEHMSVFVIRRAENRLAIWGMRSLAESLWHALETAARRLYTA